MKKFDQNGPKRRTPKQLANIATLFDKLNVESFTFAELLRLVKAQARIVSELVGRVDLIDLKGE